MKKNINISRLSAIAGIYLLIALIYIGRLLYLQVSGQDYYSMSTPARTYKRTVVIQSQRGNILDRNGKILVTNKYTYTLSLDYASEPRDNAELNDMLLSLHNMAHLTGDSESLVEPRPVFLYNISSHSSYNYTDADNASHGITFSYVDGIFETSRGRRLNKLLSELGLDRTPVSAGITNDSQTPGTPTDSSTPDYSQFYEPESVKNDMETLMLYYGIMSAERMNPNDTPAVYEYFYNYPYETAMELLAIRLDMTLSDHSTVQPYIIAKDIGIDFITTVEEKYERGYSITVNSSRDYMYPGYASHILGQIGQIQGNVKYYTDRGYPLDAIVGLSGAESAFEEYLHGTDGIMTITEDEYGNVISTEVTKEPVAGRDILLTIDVDMQVVAEKALAENIFKIREEATKPLSGEDASAGAMTVLDVNTAEILAIASYPTYNLATYREDLAALSTDVNRPYLNRALNGQYAPGSTFKVGVAVAALTEGIITKDTIIDTKGEYRFYESSKYTPRCWLYLATGRMHGPITVVEAIQESCNYFFYDVGRVLTIQKMNEYGRHYGLGEPTGIELSEKTGILAGPDYRSDNGLGQWSPGDTLQAAIGQSDNLFTPLQISSYITTILNSGVRYSCHLLKEVWDYTTNEIIYEKKTSIADSFEISDEILSVVKEGMKGVMDNGSAASVFSGYAISVGGKTGTAQVYADKSDNGIMTAFAPFEKPEIVITCVIEQAAGGTIAGYSVRDVFDYYFKIGKFAPAEDEVDDNIANDGEADNGIDDGN